jgi:hypothetical protein
MIIHLSLINLLIHLFMNMVIVIIEYIKNHILAIYMIHMINIINKNYILSTNFI